MNREDERSRSHTNLVFKIIGLTYLVVFGIYMVYEFLFNRTDTTSHIIAIVGGIVILAIAIPLAVSTVHQLGSERRYVQRHGRFDTVEGETVYAGGKEKSSNPGKRQHSKKKKRK